MDVAAVRYLRLCFLTQARSGDAKSRSDTFVPEHTEWSRKIHFNLDNATRQALLFWFSFFAGWSFKFCRRTATLIGSLLPPPKDCSRFDCF